MFLRNVCICLQVPTIQKTITDIFMNLKSQTYTIHNSSNSTELVLSCQKFFFFVEREFFNRQQNTSLLYTPEPVHTVKNLTDSKRN
jgi:hypothetical protein